MTNIVAVGEAHLRTGMHRQHMGREALTALVHVGLEHALRRLGWALQGYYRIGNRLTIGLLGQHLKRRRRRRTDHRQQQRSTK
ncbi:hypothetical protein cym2001_12900 [Pseudomonas sp. CYM-20-01]|nr:hypothetical protein cym2001_12900 [Pseudomonas sp. CYM-20-01]